MIEQDVNVTVDDKMYIPPPPIEDVYPFVIVIRWNAVVVKVPVSTITTRLPFVPVFSPSKVQLPEAVPTAQKIETALVIHREVGALLLPVHDAPVYAVLDGVRLIVSPTAALLYAANKS